MFCPNCGNYNEDAKFCSVCGASLNSQNSNGSSMDGQCYPNQDPECNHYQDVNGWDYSLNNEQPNYQQPNYEQSNYQPYNPQPYMQQEYMRDGSGQASHTLYMNTSGAIPGKGAGITSLVFGILSLVFCCIPIMGFIFALVGTITGIVSVVKSSKCGTTCGIGVGGLVCSIIGLLIGLVYTLGLFAAVWEAMYY